MKYLCAALLCAFVSNVAVASPEKEAEKLLESMAMADLLQQTVKQAVGFELQKNPALTPYEQVMLKFFGTYLSYDSLKDQFIRIYADEFTEQELKAIREFYDTPVGKKALEKTPLLTRQGMEIGQQAVQKNIHVLQKMIEKESQRIQELQAK